MRELRSYEHVAQREHWCDRCCNPIFPGEYYEGSVYADKNHGIVVFKQHKNPWCEFPPDPEEEVSIRQRRELEETIRMAA